MTREQMQKEIARMNHKIEIELTEIKNLANWLLAKADDADSITFHCPSRMIAQSESTLKELIARRDTPKKSSGRNKQWIRGSTKNSVIGAERPLRTASA